MPAINTPRTCEQLGACRLAESRECPGPCEWHGPGHEMPIQFVDTEPEPMTQFEHFLAMVGDWAGKAAMVVGCLVLGGITAGATLALILMSGGR